MSAILDEHLRATYFDEYLAVRGQLLDVLSDTDLAFRLGGSTVALGDLCREIGEIEHSYVESLRTFRQDFDYRDLDPARSRSVAAIRSWFDELDRDLRAAMASLTDDDVIGRRIARGDFELEEFNPLPAQQLDVYREALLIFYGKASVYLRALDRPMPDQWVHWIG